MIIEFLICTIDERISQIPSLLLPPMEGVQYLVSWQHSMESSRGKEEEAQTLHQLLSAELTVRQDVRVLELVGRGLSRNRNYALAHAQGDWLVIADDDCRYSVEGIAQLRAAIAEYPDAAILQLQGMDKTGRPLRNYPTQAYEYRQRPRFTYVSSWELVVRRAAELPSFDERFGIGAYLGCGEEEVFVHECSERGLSVYYLPIAWVRTDRATTGTRFATSRPVQRAKGGVLTVMHGAWGAGLRCLKYAATYREVSLVQRLRILLEMFKGIAYVYTHHPLS